MSEASIRQTLIKAQGHAGRAASTLRQLHGGVSTSVSVPSGPPVEAEAAARATLARRQAATVSVPSGPPSTAAIEASAGAELRFPELRFPAPALSPAATGEEPDAYPQARSQQTVAALLKKFPHASESDVRESLDRAMRRAKEARPSSKDPAPRPAAIGAAPSAPATTVQGGRSLLRRRATSEQPEPRREGLREAELEAPSAATPSQATPVRTRGGANLAVSSGLGPSGLARRQSVDGVASREPVRAADVAESRRPIGAAGSREVVRPAPQFSAGAARSPASVRPQPQAPAPPAAAYFAMSQQDETLAMLRQRFPELDEIAVRNALRRAKGHAGKAAASLRGLSANGHCGGVPGVAPAERSETSAPSTPLSRTRGAFEEVPRNVTASGSDPRLAMAPATATPVPFAAEPANVEAERDEPSAEIVSILCRRFPELSQNLVKAVLTQSKGHAGKAAGILRAHSSSKGAPGSGSVSARPVVLGSGAETEELDGTSLQSPGGTGNSVRASGSLNKRSVSPQGDGGTTPIFYDTVPPDAMQLDSASNSSTIFMKMTRSSLSGNTSPSRPSIGGGSPQPSDNPRRSPESHLRSISPPKDPAAVLTAMRRDSKGTPLGKRGEVWLHVYDLGAMTGRLNEVLRNTNLGAFHCGVEVLGDEWSFQGFHDAWEDPTISGVVRSEPRQHPSYIYRESVCLGETPLSEDEVDTAIDTALDTWLAHSYHLVTRNCVTFAEDFSSRVLRCPNTFPAWVRGAGDVGKSALLFPIADYGWSLIKSGSKQRSASQGNNSVDDRRRAMLRG